jgi:hypothetical protein
VFLYFLEFNNSGFSAFNPFQEIKSLREIYGADAQTI